MVTSMTGFGSKDKELPAFGKVCVEIRSINHKFLDIVLHAPEGLVSIEDKIKRLIESKILRGRITCSISAGGMTAQKVYINEELLKEYIAAFKKIKAQNRGIKGEASFDSILHLPGVVSLKEEKMPAFTQSYLKNQN